MRKGARRSGIGEVEWRGPGQFRARALRGTLKEVALQNSWRRHDQCELKSGDSKDSVQRSSIGGRS